MIKPAISANPRTVTQALGSLLRNEKRPPVILCIGSDRITGDSLGPLTGHLLTDKYNVPAFVYGTLEHPVTARNLVETSAFIKSKHPYDKILAVDAAIGRAADIGVIRVIRGGLEPGSALNRNLPKVGDFSITAVVAESGMQENIFLQDIRLHLVYSLSESIATGICDALGSIRRANLA